MASRHKLGRLTCPTRRVAAVFAVAWLWASPGLAQVSTSVGLVVQEVSVAETETSETAVEISLAPESRIALAEFTKGALGRRANIRIDGQIVMSPVITEVIVDGRLRVTGIAAGSLGRLRERVETGQASIQVELPETSK